MEGSTGIRNSASRSSQPKTVGEIIRRLAEAQPRFLAVASSQFAPLSYRELQNFIDQVRASLRLSGFRPDRPNRDMYSERSPRCFSYRGNRLFRGQHPPQSATGSSVKSRLVLRFSGRTLFFWPMRNGDSACEEAAERQRHEDYRGHCIEDNVRSPLASSMQPSEAGPGPDRCLTSRIRMLRLSYSKLPGRPRNRN